MKFYNQSSLVKTVTCRGEETITEGLKETIEVLRYEGGRKVRKIDKRMNGRFSYINERGMISVEMQ